MSDHEAIKSNIVNVLGRTKEEYFALLDEIPDELWNAPVGPPRWKYRELMAHIELSQSFVLPRTIAASLRGKKKAFPSPPPAIASFMNLVSTRLLALGATKDVLKRKYEKNDRAFLRILDRIKPGDWIKSTSYPAGNYSIEEQFLSHRTHFIHHANQIRAGIARRGT